MAATVEGPKISFSEVNDSVVLNCPIKRMQITTGNGVNVFIDGVIFYIPGDMDIAFNSLNGYPGGVLEVKNIQPPVSFLITEIGDILNPNYFKEDIRNWNGQGAAAVATAAETEAEPTVSKATRSKKAEVTE